MSTTEKTKPKATSTFERLMKDPGRRKRYEEGYREFLLSEVLVELMESEGATVRKLAKTADLSPTIVQGIKSGKRQQVTLASVSSILHALGFSLVAKKGKKEFVLA